MRVQGTCKRQDKNYHQAGEYACPSSYGRQLAFEMHLPL
jgi:hypothetical protein